MTETGPRRAEDYTDIARRSAESCIADEMNRAYGEPDEPRPTRAGSRRTSLKDKRILVTGGTKGIGRATVDQLAAAGARVMTFGRSEAELRQLLSRVGSPGKVIGKRADVTSREDLEAIFAAVDEELGGIDILVCCAALGAEPIHEMAEDDWRYVVETNLVGYLACAQAALKRMRASSGGHLLFVSSVSVEIKAEGESVYAATKAGIQAFAETLRKELAEENIKVSVMQPGATSTDMQEMSEEERREAVQDEEMLEAEEVADAIVFMLTRSARADVLNLRIEPRIQKTA